LPAAASSAVGVASDSAHGQVTTSTDAATIVARDGSIHCQATQASAASASTATRKGPAHRSASCASRGLRAEADSMRSAISRSRDSPGARESRITSGPSRFRLPADSGSPGPLGMGRLSPVSNDSSACVRPDSTAPSAGTACPTETRTRSPARSARSVTSVEPPCASSRSAVSGSRASRSPTPISARSRAPASSQRPTSRKATNIVSESK
jgi:hypothetical protein